MLVSTNSDCRLDASVYLGRSVAGVGKRNARIARGSLIAAAGTSWLNAKLNRRTIRALRDEPGNLHLALKVRITATGT